MEVKGTWMVDVVRLIRGNKDKDYSKWLIPEDWELIESNILPSVWYPLETYRRISLAAFNEVGGSDPNQSRVFGRMSMKGLVKIYKNLVALGDPGTSIQKFCDLAQNFHRGVKTKYDVKSVGQDWIEVFLYIAPEDGLSGLEDSLGYQIAGYIDELLDMTGVGESKLVFKKMPDGYQYRATWK